MSEEPALADHEARLKLLEKKIEALLVVLSKEGVLVKDDVETELNELVDGK